MTTILRASRLLLDSSSDIIDDGLVIIKDGRITQAGPWSELVDHIALSHHIQDLGDVTLMPGLFDCHASCITKA